jgi:ankyrin repeat protein
MIVRALLDNGGNILVKNKVKKILSELFLFSFFNEMEKIQNGDTMLMIAVLNESFEIVQALLRHSSSNIDEKNEVISHSKRLLSFIVIVSLEWRHCFDSGSSTW